MSKYSETIEYLYEQLPMFQSLGPGAYKPGLDVTRMIDDAFGNPHSKFKSIHVAGTNGKGSVTHTLASVLMAAGYKVGIYTSPHLIDFRERLRINGEKISEEEVVDFVDKFHELNLNCHPTFFELTTIMAFDHFARHNVDFAVVEVGLGGRLDSTNIITPILSVITNVSLDHVALLGDTLPQIAKEKGGIIKPNVPVVIGETTPETKPVYQQIANQLAAPIIFAEEHPVTVAASESGFKYSYSENGPIEIESDLIGECQPLNANTALAALRLLFSDVLPSSLPSNLTPIEATKIGMANVQSRTGLLGRWMKIKDNPEVICDTGHNPGAWTYLSRKLSAIASQRTLRIVIGFANDKDAESIFHSLPKNAIYYFVQPNVKRARPSDELLAISRQCGLNGFAFDTVEDGYKKALADCSQGDMVYVGGSNFVVAEIL